MNFHQAKAKSIQYNTIFLKKYIKIKNKFSFLIITIEARNGRRILLLKSLFKKKTISSVFYLLCGTCYALASSTFRKVRRRIRGISYD